MSKILIGCDPEVFVRFGANQIVSGIGLIGGTKDNPRPVKDGTLQEDNVLAELGIVPAEDEDQFVHRVTSVLDQLKQHLQQTHVDLSYAVQASAILDAAELQNPRAMEFGCEPDFNAWTGEKNPRPDANTNLRTAGGHIHIGYDLSLVERENVIKACDVLIGLPSVLIDGDLERMKMYGKPGAYRPKSYGVEYRTPSNFWLRSEELMRWIYKQAHRSVFAAQDTQFMEMVNANSAAITAAIAGGDTGAATGLCESFAVSW